MRQLEMILADKRSLGHQFISAKASGSSRRVNGNRKFFSISEKLRWKPPGWMSLTYYGVQGFSTAKRLKSTLERKE